MEKSPKKGTVKRKPSVKKSVKKSVESKDSGVKKKLASSNAKKVKQNIPASSTIGQVVEKEIVGKFTPKNASVTIGHVVEKSTAGKITPNIGNQFEEGANLSANATLGMSASADLEVGNELSANTTLGITASADLKVGEDTNSDEINDAVSITANQMEEGDTQSSQKSSADRAQNEAQKNWSIPLEFSEFEEKIENKLLKLDELTSEKNKEEIRLFVGRCAFRVFPLAINEILSNSFPSDKNITSHQILVVWRAALISWNNEIDLSKANSVAKAANNLYEEIKNSTAINAIASASMYAANYASEDGSIVPALNSYNLSAEAVAQNVEITQANHEDPSDDMLSTYETAFNAANLDLELMLNPDNSAGDLRRKPLWHEQVISKNDWQSELKNLISEINEDELSESSIAFKKIIVDYSAILKGVWTDDGKSLEQLTRDTADEKPRQDLPSAIDYLGRDQLVDALAPRLSKKDYDNHLTVGLLGNWGIGKSSVLEQLQKKLNEVEHCDYVFATFNAWSYEHSKSLQAGIAHEVLSALTTAQTANLSELEKQSIPAEKRWPWYRRWLYKPNVVRRYVISLHGYSILAVLMPLFILSLVSGYWAVTAEVLMSKEVVLGLGGFGGLLILVISKLKTLLALPLAKELKTYIRLPSYQEYLGTIPEMKKNIDALCDICLGKNFWGKNRRLVFFVDDLDRCGVDGIVKTFEAVRLVLDIPWVTVVIAMDQRIALPALACHYENLSKFHQLDPMSIARDYLAKVIHLPIRLQAPDDLSVARYLAHIWNDEQFLNKIKVEREIISGVEANLDDETQQDNSDLSEDGNQNEKPKELQEDIIRDINSIDIQSALQPEQGSEKPDKPKVKENQGFGPEQKDTFYNWLIKFNLRNPRQIKRLYNSYNLLWSIYDKGWKEHKEDWYPNMLALLVLEMINEYVHFNEKVDTRGQYSLAFFNVNGYEKVESINKVKSADIKEAHKVILAYQKDKKVDLMRRLEPFVLPAIRPQDINNT